MSKFIEERLAKVCAQLQEWLGETAGDPCADDAPQVGLAMTRYTAAITVGDFCVWEDQNGYAEDVEDGSEDVSNGAVDTPTFEACLATFQRYCARLARFAPPPATAVNFAAVDQTPEKIADRAFSDAPPTPACANRAHLIEPNGRYRYCRRTGAEIFPGTGEVTTVQWVPGIDEFRRAIAGLAESKTRAAFDRLTYMMKAKDSLRVDLVEEASAALYDWRTANGVV